MQKERLRNYARLIARVGGNVQPGQDVFLTAEIDQPEFVQMVVEECYKLGAKKVIVDWTDQKTSKIHTKYRSLETMSTMEKWEKERWQHRVDTIPCRIYIESEDPDAMSGIDPDKLSAVSQSRSLVVKPYRDAIEGKHQWVIAGYPSEKWAKKCFPDADNAEELLWEAILKTVRVS